MQLSVSEKGDLPILQERQRFPLYYLVIPHLGLPFGQFVKLETMSLVGQEIILVPLLLTRGSQIAWAAETPGGLIRTKNWPPYPALMQTVWGKA